MVIRRLALGAVCFLLTTCGSSSVPRFAKFTFSVSLGSSTDDGGGVFVDPASAEIAGAAVGAASDLDCFGVLITGPGIDSKDPTVDGDKTSTAAVTDYCSYPGVSSAFTTVKTRTALEVSVPVGRPVLIQVVGMDVAAPLTCPDVSVADFMVAYRHGGTAASSYTGGLFEVGRTITTLSESGAIEVTNVFDPGNTRNLMDCNASSSANALSFKETGLVGQINSSRVIEAEGGTPPYTYSASAGASYSSGTSLFTLAASTGTSQLVVTDAKGGKRTLTMAVVSPAVLGTTPIVPALWYSADNYISQADGSDVTTDWVNNGSLGSADLVPIVGNVPKAWKTAGPKRTPYVEFNASEFHKSGIGTATFAHAHSFYVLRVNAGNLGGVSCISAYSDCITASAYFLFGLGASSLYSKVTENSNVDVTPETLSFDQEWMLVESDFQSGAGARLTLPSGTVASTTTNVSAPLSVGSGYVFLGKDGVSSNKFRGGIAEWIQFQGSTAFPTDTLTAYRNYLKTKYGL